MVQTTPIAPKNRRPPCGQCSGTGYVYLWSVARAGTRTWYCDRCKRSWVEAEPAPQTTAHQPILEPVRLVAKALAAIAGD